MSEHESQAARESAIRTLREAERFLLVGHQRPDGDCVGSQAALARVLESLGKTAVVQNPDAPAAEFSYLTEAGPFGVWNGDGLPEHDVCVLLDFNDLSRTGPMAEALGGAPSRKLIVDHHPLGPEVWWDEAFVDVSASATGLLVHRIAGLLGVEVDPVVARAVFTALVTDTGWFRYSNTDGETLATAAGLLGHGVETAEMFRAIHQRTSRDEPLALAAALTRTRYHAGGRLAVVDLPRGEGPELADSNTLLDVLRAVESVEVVLFLRELAAGGVKLSARSKTDFDVNRLARRFGGGGHRKAAGATIDGTLDDVRAALVAAAEGAFEPGGSGS